MTIGLTDLVSAQNLSGGADSDPAPVTPAPGAAARGAGIDDLMAMLALTDLEGWQEVEAKIRVEWARSGSHAMDLLLARAGEALEAEDLAAAYEHARALTDHAPDFAEGWNTLAMVLFQQGNFGPTLDALERTIALNPDHYDALAGLGAVLRDIGETEAALRAFRASEAIHPHRAEIGAAIEALETRLEGKDI